MADIITLAAARAALRADPAESDETIQSLIDSATGIVANRMQRPISGEGGWPEGEVPAPVVQAIKFVMVVLYDRPDAPVVDDEVLLGMVGTYCKPSFG